MHAARFDHLTRTLTAGLSRRQILLGLAGALLAGQGSAARAGATSERALTSVSRRPIPLADGRLLMNGKPISLDLPALLAAFRDGAETVPHLVDEATYVLDAQVIGRAARLAQVVAPPLREGPPPGEILEQVCGSDETQDVELYDGCLGVSKAFVSQRQPSVGVLRWRGDVVRRYEKPGNVNGVRWCSGTLIASDLFLTAGHCLWSVPPDPSWKVPRIDGTNEPIPSSEIATNMKVEFDYQLDQDGNDRPPQPFNVVELVECECSGDVDYAILRLEGAPGDRFGVSPIAGHDVAPGHRLCIIGHPQGQSKRLAVGTATEYQYGRLYYRDLDTAGGCSGAAILASPGGPIVGVHTAGGCLDAMTGNNHGVPISSLLAASPLLRAARDQA